jgi:hypothetical protein
MPQALGRVAGPLRVRGQPLNLLRACRADYLELDGDLFEVGVRLIDVVLFGVAKGRPDVSRRVIDRYLVERREPRQLREQSKCDAHHEELQRRRALFGAAASQGLVCLHSELAHAALEVDVLDDPRHGACCDIAVVRRLGAHLNPQALDLAHLLVEVHASPPWRGCPTHISGMVIRTRLGESPQPAGDRRHQLRRQPGRALVVGVETCRVDQQAVPGWNIWTVKFGLCMPARIWTQTRVGTVRSLLPSSQSVGTRRIRRTA